jgi:hypothetical protein
VTRILVIFYALLLLATPVQANDLPVGKFKVLNTAGFVQEHGIRKPLERDSKTGMAEIVHEQDNSLIVTIGGTDIQLFPMENGLAALEWNASDTTLLHGIDIEALNNKTKRNEIPAWGAELPWQNMGKVQLALLPLGETAYTGFLISHPKDKTVVRQMEFRQVFGPANRPRR